jgi:hypothetical protein
MGQDYLEQLVLSEIQKRMEAATLPLGVTAQDALLFSSLSYFPLESKKQDCFAQDFYKFADSCTSSSDPLSVRSQRFSAMYGKILGNTVVTPKSMGSKFLESTAHLILTCRNATLSPSYMNGGACAHVGQAKSNVPSYQLRWVKGLPQQPMKFSVEMWRKGASQPWNNAKGSTVPGGSETLSADITYEDFKVAVVDPLSFDHSYKTGWYDEGLLDGIREGFLSDGDTEDELKISQLSTNLVDFTAFRRARVFFMAGSVKFSMIVGSTDFDPVANASKSTALRAMKFIPELAVASVEEPTPPIRQGIRLTPHLQIPNVRIIPTTSRSFRPEGLQADFELPFDGESQSVTSEWISGDLYTEFQAGYILAVITSHPLTSNELA